jgi:cephalosporin hydroxylase
MKLFIDTDAATLTEEDNGHTRTLNLYSSEAFEALSRQWVRVGWNQKYQYTFSWMGRPIIQLPEDMVRIQEVLYQVRPDVIVETGVAHGGSLIFYASICKLLGNGRVIGIDVEIRPPNRAAIERHELFERISLIEGDSKAPETVAKVRSQIRPGETVLVLLDSNHTRGHVLEELESYAELVTPGSYIVATDGIMADLFDLPRGKANWSRDNPATAAAEFAHNHPEFVLEQPARVFCESELTNNVTHWPNGWLKRSR